MKTKSSIPAHQRTLLQRFQALTTKMCYSLCVLLLVFFWFFFFFVFLWVMVSNQGPKTLKGDYLN